MSDLIITGPSRGIGRALAFAHASGHPDDRLFLVARDRTRLADLAGEKLTADLSSDARFYFVHSYYVRADDPTDSILRAHYGIDFDAAVHRGNIYGAQFHPEKSHRFGMQLLTNFAKL